MGGSKTVRPVDKFFQAGFAKSAQGKIESPVVRPRDRQKQQEW